MYLHCDVNHNKNPMTCCQSHIAPLQKLHQNLSITLSYPTDRWTVKAQRHDLICWR